MASENLTIEDFDLFLCGSEWCQKTAYPSLHIAIRASSDNQDIASIRWEFHDGISYRSGSFSDPVIDALSLNMKCDVSDFLWDLGDADEISLASRLTKIYHETEIPVRDAVCSVWPTITNQEVVGSCNPMKWFADVFLAQSALYLVYMALLYDNYIWTTLPINFPLPYSHFDQRVLSRDTMIYMRTPLRACRVLGNSFMRELEWLLSGFLNFWVDIYVAGDPLDTVKLHIDLINSIAETFMIELDTRSTQLFESRAIESENCQKIESLKGKLKSNKRNFEKLALTVSRLQENVAELTTRLNAKFDERPHARVDRDADFLPQQASPGIEGMAYGEIETSSGSED